MRPSLTLKILLRTPFKTLLTFLLLAAASFALFSRVSEYAVTAREMRNAAGYYRGVGALDTGVPYTAGKDKYSNLHESVYTAPPALTKEQIDAFASLPQVTSMDTRYMTTGISDSHYRVDMPYDPSYNYTTRFVLEGTFNKHAPYRDITGEIWPNLIILSFTDCRLLAGAPSLLPGGRGSISVGVVAEDGMTGVGSVSGNVGVSRVHYMINDNPFGRSFVDTLTGGSRYLLIGRWDPRSPEDSPMLGDQDTMDYCDSFWELDGKPENYLETGEFSRVRELMEITDSDLRAFDMVYTSDMSSIPRFAEKKMAVAEGRALTPEDLGYSFCVVSQAFLKTNRMEIGDRITMGLCGKLLEQHSGLGAVACIPERYSRPVETVELEIVGAYIDTDTVSDRAAYMNWSYSPSAIFVPSTLLPVDPPEDHGIKPGEFSFVIGDARGIEGFLELAGPLAEELGLELRFDDGGWAQVSQGIEVSTQMSLITTVLFVCAAAIALLLAVYLFIGRGRREYAIMRALGTPIGLARRTLLLRLGALSACAIPVGAAAGLIYTSRSVSSALAGIAAAVTADYVPDTSLPIAAVVACALGELAFLSLLSALMLRRLGKTRPLALLQGDGGKGRRPAAIPTRSAAATPLPAVTPGTVRMEVPEGRRYSAARHVLRYIARHMRRTGWKTALTVLLAALLPGAMGLFAVMRLSYEDLFNSVEIKCFIKDISSDAAIKASSSSLIREHYYQGGFEVVCDSVRYYSQPQVPLLNFGSLILTNDLDRCLRGAAATVEYAEGYDASFMSEEGAQQCVLGSGLAEILGAEAGDEVTLMSFDRYPMFLGSFEGEELERQLTRNSIPYKVVGIVSSEDEGISRSVFAPVGRAAEKVHGDMFTLETGEFVLADNEKAEELRSYAETLVSQSLRLSQFAAYVMDTTELENIIRILDLLKLLFPIAVAAAVLTGLIAPGLIIVQSAKEAAILRVLGTTKKRARCMLALEQLFLCTAGLAAAAAGLAAYNAELFMRAAKTLAICGGLFLLGCTLAVSLAAAEVTRRRALELLQAKE